MALKFLVFLESNLMDSKFNQMYFYLFNFSVLVTWSSTHLINHSHLSFNHQLLFIPTISLDHSFRPLQQQQPPNNSSCWTFTSRKVFFFSPVVYEPVIFQKTKTPIALQPCIWSIVSHPCFRSISSPSLTFHFNPSHPSRLSNIQAIHALPTHLLLRNR